MTAPGSELARRIADLERRLASVERGSQAKFRSYETAAGETVVIPDALDYARAPVDGDRLADVVELGTTRIIAGDPVGARVELHPDGITAVDADGNANVSITPAGSDYLTLTSSDGSTSSSIADNGVGSFQSIAVADSLTYEGREMSDHLGDIGYGVLARGTWQIGAWSPWSTNRGLFEVAADLVAGRLYRVVCGPAQMQGDTVGDEVGAWVRYTNDGSAPSTSSTRLAYCCGTIPVAGTVISPHVIREFAADVTGTWRFLAGYSALAHNARVYTDSSRILSLSITDLGPAPDDIAITNDGGATPPTVKKTYTRTYAASWSGSYDGAGAYNSFYGNGVNQGYYSSTNGNQKGMVGFPSTVATDLTGATVNKVEVYLYANHWFYNYGGTAVLGVHGATSRPGTFSGSTNLLQSAGWPKPGGRWVTLPSSLYAGFAAGTYRGVVLGPGPTTGPSYYGKFDGVGAAHPPILRATYTK